MRNKTANQAASTVVRRLCCPFCLAPVGGERPGLASKGENRDRWYYTDCGHPASSSQAIWLDVPVTAPGGMQ